MQKLSSNSYVRVLENWVEGAAKYFYTPADSSEIMCYGTGESHHWAVQTNMNAFAAFAVLATSPDLDESAIDMSRSKLLDVSLKMLRYSLRTHHCGERFCSNNRQWGHSWISVLALERMMHGFDAVEEFLDEADKLAMRRILESESNNILDHYEIVAGIEYSINKPESNIWNGAMLLRTTAYYPDTPRKDEYLQKATAFFINGISIPSDNATTKIINGKMIKEWHIGPNFTKNLSLNHHDYMNVGYMVICLSNIAMLHFSLKTRGIAPPDEVYFHAQELWEAIKQFIFSDGRLLRIGGDTRARYCYCQDYAVPMWLFVMDKYGDEDALQYEAGWLQQVTRETAVNADGSFLSTRLAAMAQVNPFYYTRLEGDRAVTMSYGAYWRRLYESLPQQISSNFKEAKVLWQDEFHGATLARDTNQIASWVWKAGQRPTGLCVPPNRSDMAEWQHNLSGELVTSNIAVPSIISDGHDIFAGGFVNYGCLHWTERSPLGEGETEDVFAQHGIVFAALPDNKTVICLQYAETSRRIYLPYIKGLGLKMPNDLFNNFKRKYVSAGGTVELAGCPDKEEIIKLKSSWLNIDDCLAVFTIYGDEQLTIYRPAERQINIKDKPTLTSLYADEICSVFKADKNIEPSNKIVIDTAVMLMTGIDAVASKKISEQQCWQIIAMGAEIRAVSGRDANGQEYLLIANFTQATKRVDLTLFSATHQLVSLTSPEKPIQDNELSIEPFTAHLLKIM
ncbi:MAG: hypothetical protein L3J71_13160 [Victivallaceae bacterium]|nr:hypothetical protein [Victivallaceae bacterium]